MVREPPLHKEDGQLPLRPHLIIGVDRIIEIVAFEAAEAGATDHPTRNRFGKSQGAQTIWPALRWACGRMSYDPEICWEHKKSQLSGAAFTACSVGPLVETVGLETLLVVMVDQEFYCK